jgi:YfiR/HmsC-like
LETLTRSRRGLFALWTALLLGLGVDALAQQAAEPTVKAAFLYKFAGYVEWPPATFAAADSPFVIGVLGADEVAAELERIVPGRTVNDHRVVVRRLKEGEPPRGVNLLFVGRAEASLRPILRAAQAQGVLTVTETERGLELGSAINFVVSEDRVGFEVSLDSADRVGLRISSRMLAVARRVVPKP